MIWPEEGGAWICKVNIHRHRFNGTICEAPANWNCGADQQFRERHCARGDSRCFHLAMFADIDPTFEMHKNGGSWLMDADPEALRGQLLFFWTPAYNEEYGRLPNSRAEVVAGLYVVESVELRNSFAYVVRPRKMINLSGMHIRKPYVTKISRGPYLNHLSSTAVSQVRRDALAAAEAEGREDLVSFFRDQFDGFMEVASENNARLAKDHTAPVRVHREPGSETLGTLGDKLGQVQVRVRKRPESPVEPSPAQELEDRVEEEVDARRPLSDFETLREALGLYDDETARLTWLATRADNALVALSGPPGIGKSTTALRLAPEELRHVVAVNSTWRGAEELQGWTSPVDGKFQPTEFCEFIRETAKAYESGDKRRRLVVFEEFNLSPPEYWFSEVLNRSQYGPDERELRRFPTVGELPEGWRAEEVWLSPNVVFVATMNVDHTTQRLSPRVLDRATVVNLRLDVSLLVRRNDSVEPEVGDALEHLGRLLADRELGVSYRTINSVDLAIQECETMGLTATSAVDLVVANQLLGRVRLYASEPGDLEFIESLESDWVETFGASLPSTASRIEGMRERLENGLDVEPA